jgi:hypothetical protein
MNRFYARALGRLDGAVFLTSGSALDLLAAMLARLWRALT